MPFERLKNALLSVLPNVGHYSAFDKGEQYIVWMEDGAGDTLEADNVCVEQVLTGTVHYFTKLERDENTQAIQMALSRADISWRLSSIQHEQDTGYTHYEWRWEVA